MSDGRILVIDDSEFVLARVKSVLTQAGYEVQTTTQTVGAGRYLRSTDLVLLDFHMPGIDGGMVLESLKNAAQSTSSPCAFYLFTSDEEVATRYASLGFDGVIRNKGELDGLVGQVRAAMRMKKMRQIARRHKTDSPPPAVSSSGPPPGQEAGAPLRIGSPPVPQLNPSELLLSSSRSASTTPVPAPPHRSSTTSAPPPPRRRHDTAREGTTLESLGLASRSVSAQREPADDDDDATADLPRTPT